MAFPFPRSIAILLFGAIFATASPCDTLADQFPEQVFFDDDSEYNASISSYTWVQTQLHPTCIVQPESAEDVAQLVKSLGHLNTAFAVRGGGHSVNKGFSNIDQGVTIDLRKMNTTDLVDLGPAGDGEDGTLEIGPGALWGPVYDYIDPKNISVLGGRVYDVGVAGLTTGGGISFFSTERGFVCDGVTNFEVVLSNATVVNANATSNVGLFQALKGGQNNFGIVTKFSFLTFKQGPMWGSSILFSNKSEHDLLQAVTDHKLAPFDSSAMFVAQFLYFLPDQTRQCVSNIWYLKPDAPKTSLDQFLSIEPRLNLTESVESAGKQVLHAIQPIPPGTFELWATTTLRISKTVLFKLHPLWEARIDALTEKYGKTNKTIMWAYGFQGMPTASDSNSLGINPAAHPEESWLNMLGLFQYNDASLTEELQNVVLSFIDEAEKVTKEEGVYEAYKYLNYAHWKQDIFSGYGKESLERMRKVAKEYDPVAMFQKQVTGGYKLW
ncbi:hypothetical protein BDV96DRAFT_660969 [Lophiotrema nucula]|uniref:FAD-binding PCMH-type domain-containing protein n=1 Tax=Lophiotrema nucula TaxID=690887 RepID=A0A6A5Z709_9PLEO|nr:hypothetical protein BDV96DRAFT_660969 [Lophiotrema nucula]